MNSNMLVVDFFMEIRKNVTRFLSLLLIVALGVAFYSGIRAAEPDMQLSADALYDDSRFMDIRIVSTLGFTSEDVLAVQDLKGVEAAEGFYSADVLCDGEEEQFVLHLMSGSETMNQCTVSEGRLPERPSECLIDELLAERAGFKVGDKLTVSSGTGDDIMDTLNVKEYTIVGIGGHPSYISRERGTSAVGDGSVDGFVILDPMAFSLTAYTEIDVLVDRADMLTSFSSEYEDAVQVVADRIEEIQETRSTLRYDSVKETAEAELTKAETDLVAAEQELTDSRTRLEQAEAELAQAKAEIELKIQEVMSGHTTIAEQEAALAESTTKLAQAKAELDATMLDLSAKQQQLNVGKAQLDASRAELTDAYSEWTDQNNEIVSRWNMLEQAEAKLQEQRETLESKKAQLEELLGQQVSIHVEQAVYASSAEGVVSQSSTDGAAENPGNVEPTGDPGFATEIPQATPEPTEGPTSSPVESEPAPTPTEPVGTDGTQPPSQVDTAQLEQEIAQLESDIASRESELSAQRSQLEEATNALNSTKSQLDQLNAQLENEVALYNASVQELSLASAQLVLGEAEYNKQKATLDAGLQALNVAKQALENGQTTISDSQLQIAGAEQELLQGKQNYEAAVQESEQKLKDAREELNDKKREVAKMSVPKWYILDRSYTESCEGFRQDSERVGAIGTVFPLIFFIVAALVSLTTITRMVEEQRTQIGTMKALGFEKHVIAGKYICYAIAASLIGGVLGLVLGQLILPRVIINAYKILYTGIPKAITPLNFWYSISSLAVAVACTAVAAFFACYRELRAVPAELIRPVAPKNGRRVMLERVSLIWKHLNFSQKAAVRNMFRYKKRFFMTLFGIAGCMGLLLVGFGVRDSVMSVADKQFGELTDYTASLTLETTDLAPVRTLESALEQDERVENHLSVYSAALSAELENSEESVYLVVPENGEALSDYITLRNRRGGKSLKLKDDGVIISEKLSAILGVKAGDLITLVDNDNYHVEVKVSGITENYFQHYVYMSPAYYDTIYGGEPDYNTIYIKNSSLDEEEMQEFLTDCNEYEAVGSVTDIQNYIDSIHDMLKSMNMVVVVLIVSAGLLAFVVLYNLNNIAITERRRELASLKVLGFYDRDVTVYVLRENFMMVCIGILGGIVVGVILHQFVIRTVEVDMLMFGRSIYWQSYLFSILLTIVFAVAVNIIMHWKLKKIDMVESLKSVE